MNAILALDLLLEISDKGQKIAAMLKTAQEEGRDITDAELEEIDAEYEQSFTGLKKAIQEKRERDKSGG